MSAEKKFTEGQKIWVSGTYEGVSPSGLMHNVALGEVKMRVSDKDVCTIEALESQIPKGEVYTREQMFVMFISLVEHSDVVFSAIKESGAETVGESFDYVMTVINNAKTKHNEQTT